MSLIGMHSTEAQMGSVGVLGAIKAQLLAGAAANGATAAAVLPPGNEGASARALANQSANAATFAANFALGIEEMLKLIPTLASASVTHEITALDAAKRF